MGDYNAVAHLNTEIKCKERATYISPDGFMLSSGRGARQLLFFHPVADTVGEIQGQPLSM